MDEESYIRQRYYYKNVKEKLYTKVYCLYGCIGYIILAPLHTISIQMQLSVSAHKDIYHDIIPKTDNLLENKGGVFSKLSEKYVPLINNAFNNIKKNEIEKIEKNLSIKLKKQDKELTLRDKRNINLVKMSGVPEGQQPYRAAIYDNYKQMFKSYNKQGILSLYKGLFNRICFNIGSIYLNTTLLLYLDMNFKGIEYLNRLISLTIINCLLNPLFVMENRYILQNRLPHFRTYQSIFTILTREKFTLLQNISTHAIKNIYYFSTFGILSFINNNTFYNILATEALSYPIFTAFRRLVCQSTSAPGMIPHRYYNIFHAISLIYKEEGIRKGLYKGFLPYSIALIIYQSIIFSFVLPTYMEKSKKDFFLLDDDEIFKDLQERKLKNLIN